MFFTEGMIKISSDMFLSNISNFYPWKRLKAISRTKIESTHITLSKNVFLGCEMSGIVVLVKKVDINKLMVLYNDFNTQSSMPTWKSGISGISYAI